MKLQCDLCREIVVADFAVVGSGIEVRCPSCEKSFTVTPTRVAGQTISFAAPAAASAKPRGEMRCPKCGDEQPKAPACRSCGLLADRMGDFARDRDVEVPPEVAAAWRAVEASWPDDTLHDRFIEAVAIQVAYPYAAGRYREALRLRPDDRRAAENLARVARMAEATLLASATRKPGATAKPYRTTLVMMAIVILLMVVGLGFAVFSKSFLGRGDDDAPPPTAPHARPG